MPFHNLFKSNFRNASGQPWASSRPSVLLFLKWVGGRLCLMGGGKATTLTPKKCSTKKNITPPRPTARLGWVSKGMDLVTGLSMNNPMGWKQFCYRIPCDIIADIFGDFLDEHAAATRAGEEALATLEQKRRNCRIGRYSILNKKRVQSAIARFVFLLWNFTLKLVL